MPNQFVPDRTFSFTEPISSISVPFFEPVEEFAQGNCLQTTRLTNHAWSPLGLSVDGSPILVICLCSNNTLDFRVLGCGQRYPFIEFSETSNLCEILREEWLRLVLFSTIKQPITRKYPSLSGCIEPPQPRGIASFSPNSIGTGSSLLAIGWGELIFIWRMSSGKNPVVLGAISPTGSHTVENPIASFTWSAQPPKSLDASCDLLGLSVVLSDGGSQTLEIRIKKLNQEIEIEDIHASPISRRQGSHSFSKNVGHKDTLNSTLGVGLCLATCPSPNAALDFALKRTSGSVHITRSLALTSVADAIRMMISVVSQYENKPVTDLAVALGNLYSLDLESKSAETRILPLDQNDLLGSVAVRLTQECLDYSQVSESVGKRLAFGLHHLHSRIDPIAAANSRARISERKMILSRITGNSLERLVDPCIRCNSELKVMDDCQYALCENQHRFELCQESMQPLRREAVRCNFCWLAVNNGSMPSVHVCQICRIGITSSVVG